MGAFGRQLIRVWGGDIDAYNGDKKSEKPQLNKQFKVIVAGSRDYTDYDFVREKLDHLLQNVKDEIVIVSGRCSTGTETFEDCNCVKVCGADGLGERYALEKGYNTLEFPADWENTHDKSRTEVSFRNNRPYWTKAGIFRNGQMADIGDALVCFVLNNSKGSLNMIKQAKERGLKVKVYNIEK